MWILAARISRTRTDRSMLGGSDGLPSTVRSGDMSEASRIRLRPCLESYAVGSFGASFFGTRSFLWLGAGGPARGGPYSQNPYLGRGESWPGKFSRASAARRGIRPKRDASLDSPEPCESIHVILCVCKPVTLAFAAATLLVERSMDWSPPSHLI